MSGGASRVGDLLGVLEEECRYQLDWNQVRWLPQGPPDAVLRSLCPNNCSLNGVCQEGLHRHLTHVFPPLTLSISVAVDDVVAKCDNRVRVVIRTTSGESKELSNYLTEGGRGRFLVCFIV